VSLPGMRKPPVGELVDQDSLHLDYQGLLCCSTVPRCRCPARPSTTWRGSSAATWSRSGRGGGS